VPDVPSGGKTKIALVGGCGVTVNVLFKHVSTASITGAIFSGGQVREKNCQNSLTSAAYLNSPKGFDSKAQRNALGKGEAKKPKR
jgi:hypothetical protein